MHSKLEYHQWMRQPFNSIDTAENFHQLMSRKWFSSKYNIYAEFCTSIQYCVNWILSECVGA